MVIFHKKWFEQQAPKSNIIFCKYTIASRLIGFSSRSIERMVQFMTYDPQLAMIAS